MQNLEKLEKLKILSVTEDDFLNTSLIQKRVNEDSYLKVGERISIETAKGSVKIYTKN